MQHDPRRLLPVVLLVAGLAWSPAGCSDTEHGPGSEASVKHDSLLDLPQDSGADRPRKDTGPKDLPRDKPRPKDKKLPPDKGQPDKPGKDLSPGKGPLRVATLNCYCLKNNPATRAKGIAAQLKQLNPDAVAMQEVCQTAGKGGADNFAKLLIKELKAATGQDWEHRFAKTHLAWSTYDEGLGLLARKGTFAASGEQSLPNVGSFPRKVIWGKISTPRGAFYLYSTHLTISSNPNHRKQQAQAIVALANKHSAANLPQVVMGDFNDWYASGAVNAMKQGPPAFTEAWGTKHPGAAKPGLTCCTPNFKSRIDYVFISSKQLNSLHRVELAFDKQHQGVWLSDHRGLFAEFYTK